MKYSIIFTLIFIYSASHSQSKTLSFKQTFFSLNFYEGENKISVSDYRDLLSSDKSNLSKFDSGMGDLKTSQIISAIGGGLIGWPIGQSLANNPLRKPAW
jgi:hypothetical protein